MRGLFGKRWAGAPHHRVAARYAIIGGIALAVGAPLSGMAPLNLVEEARGKPAIKFDAHRGAVSVDHFIEGELSKDGTGRKVYPLLLRRGEAAVFDLSSRDFDAKLQILSRAGQELVSDDDAGGDTNARLHFAMTPDLGGQIYLVASSADSRVGGFKLEIRRRAAPAPDKTAAISSDAPVSGRLEERSPLRLKEQRIFRSYLFEGNSGERIQLSAKSDKIPIELELVREGAGELAATRNPGTAVSFFRTLQDSGTYRVSVLGKPDEYGDFELWLKRLPPPRLAVPEPISVGSTVQGTFRVDSPVLPGTANRPYLLYQIEGKAGQLVALSASMERPDDPALRRRSLTVDVGVDSPAGFAAVQPIDVRREPDGVRQETVRFEGDGSVLIRVAGPSGAVGPFELKIAAVSATANQDGPD